MDTSNRPPASASTEPADVDAWWDMPPTPEPTLWIARSGRLVYDIAGDSCRGWRDFSGT